jgi:hypothetical protein
MKNLLITILALVTLFFASLTLTSSASATTVKLAVPYYERVVVGDIIYIYEYDGPGGKLVNVWVEGND